MIAAIVQARLGSTRLPGKVLMELSGRPMLWHVVERLRHAEGLDEIMVATSLDASDDRIAEFCAQEAVPCFRGSETDVLDRYFRTAGSLGADIIVRITSDCPLVDPQVVARVLAACVDGDCDYASNTIERSYPDGLDAEAFTFFALETAWREARLASEREHVTPYIWKHGDRFTLKAVRQDRDLSGLRWTVDEVEDMDFVRQIYNNLFKPGQVFLMDEVCRLLERNPELLHINQGIERNAGYLRSLAEDSPT